MLECAYGPLICSECGEWPALNASGLCNQCDDLKYARTHPVDGGEEC